MIVGGHHPLPIGYRGVGLSDQQGRDHPEQPFVVIREATAEEYLAEKRAEGTELSAKQLAFIAAGRAFFYEVSID